MPSEFDNFSRYMSEEFCNETFTSLSPPNLAMHVATVPCKASNNFESVPITFQCFRQSGAASSDTEQHLSWYSTIEKIFVSNK